MKTVAHPAARPASISRQRSPTMTLRLRSSSSAAAASTRSPGAGLRHVHRRCRRGGIRAYFVDWESIGQPLIDGVDLRRDSEFLARCRADSSPPREQVPRRRVRASASSTPAIRRTSSGPSGGYGRPSTTRASFNTPSRSRKTAGRRVRTRLDTVGGGEASSTSASSAARSASRVPRSHVQPSAWIRDVSKRITGTSPSQPERPPVYSNVTRAGSRPAASTAMPAISVTVM